MIKSLYVRMVFAFLGSVLISVVVSFIVNGRIYSDELRTYMMESMVANGKTIIQSYEQSYPHNLDALVKGWTAFPIYSARLFDKGGKPLHESEASGSRFEVSSDQLNLVLLGGVYKNTKKHGFNHMMVGLPFRINGEPYALFMKSDISEFALLLSGFFRNQLLIVLFFGSIFIMISARYIVRPLQHLTRATRKMSKGDFSIRLNTKRRDEIGQLTESFNHMAHELGALEQIRKQFVSDVSHEIQSPLTSIKGFTQALKHKKMDESARLHLLDIIEEESNRLSRLSEDLLQLSSLEYENLSLNVRQYRLDEQIRHVIIALEPQWASKRLDIELDLAETTIAADEDKLNQLWTNLLSNSVKFTSELGHIAVKASKVDGGIEVAIADSGQGIPEEEIGSIFKPFYKVDKSRDRTIHGNGIGLSIVKRVVDLHQGDIRVTSQPGQGTTFRIYLPQSE
ncbi:sensor histidine kinase [Cohnella boryungensis]|uniref:Heme sensor protein HssS n=1 Tax=Cohnella boryungensis TaxID=768479 RepID=A0ABV8SK03_9BACL